MSPFQTSDARRSYPSSKLISLFARPRLQLLPDLHVLRAPDLEGVVAVEIETNMVPESQLQTECSIGVHSGAAATQCLQRVLSLVTVLEHDVRGGDGRGSRDAHSAVDQDSLLLVLQESGWAGQNGLVLLAAARIGVVGVGEEIGSLLGEGDISK